MNGAVTQETGQSAGLCGHAETAKWLLKGHLSICETHASPRAPPQPSGPLGNLVLIMVVGVVAPDLTRMKSDCVQDGFLSPFLLPPAAGRGLHKPQPPFQRSCVNDRIKAR